MAGYWRFVGAAGMLALAQPASAALLTATVTGTISIQRDGSGAFDLGVFGDGYRSLTGQAFSVTYRFDTDDAAYRVSYAGVFSPVTLATGGAWSPVQSPSFGQAALTIAGRTVSFDGISFGSLSAGTGERTFDVVDSSRPGVFFSVAANLFDASLGFPAALETPGTWSGGFDRAADPNSGFFIDYGGGRLAAGGLIPTSVSIAISAVPEPAGWAMMIVGFLAVGGVLRGAPTRHRFSRGAKSIRARSPINPAPTRPSTSS